MSQMPHEGGRYIRRKDGGLERVAYTTEPQPEVVPLDAPVPVAAPPPVAPAKRKGGAANV